MSNRIRDVHWSLLKWAVLPMATFLLAMLVTRQLLRAKEGGDAARFEKTLGESIRKFDAGDREGALKGLEAAAKVVPNDPAKRLDLAKRFEHLGQRGQAAEQMEEMLRLRKDDQNATNYARLVEYYLNQGNVENAKRVLMGDLIARWPESLETAYLQGLIGLKDAKGKAEVEQAKQFFQKCAEINPEHIPSKIQLGIAYWRLGQSEKAEPLLRAVIEKRPSSVVALYHLGEVLRQEGKLEEAKKCLDEHRKISDLWQRKRHLEVQYSLRKHKTEDLLELGRIYWDLSEFDSAASTFRVYTRLKPTDPVGQRELAKACLKLNDQEGARVATELADALSARSQKP